MLALRPDQVRTTLTGSGVKASPLVGEGKKKKEKRKKEIDVEDLCNKPERIAYKGR